MAVALRPVAPLPPPRGTVPEQLRVVLARLRADGLLFEQAWIESWDLIAWPLSQRETLEWEKALEGTKETWRARYERWDQTPEEKAVAGLGAALEAALADAA